ncbi:ABC transporter ATP-binding protein [Candidatus Hecatella orcuttiae]|jgi:branched-chain amino acid transport system ATP-binding protein|uniref:ABC transporter ATP-binding protein n=1 Tax=Candidatus Hecatella orcuttiae TaxID=1935119 RepID=UPI002867E621|nr:ABC transporter ATP-binding protein [Candidatus Hecatella orcuttiae]
MTILRLNKIDKRFGGIKALKSVDFEVEEASIAGIVGPNGAGKTTLFNIVTGYYKPDGGYVIFDNKNITGLKPHQICKMGIARTYQIVRPFKDMRVFDNIMVGAKFGRPLDKRNPEKWAREVLEFTGLINRANEFARNLTFTELRRFEVARALACNPKILLLDEVLAGLNPAEVTVACEMIKKINKEFNITIVIIEHVLKGVWALAEKVMVLHHGEKIGEGKPEEVFKMKQVEEAYLGTRWEAVA